MPLLIYRAEVSITRLRESTLETLGESVGRLRCEAVWLGWVLRTSLPGAAPARRSHLRLHSESAVLHTSETGVDRHAERARGRP